MDADINVSDPIRSIGIFSVSSAVKIFDENFYQTTSIKQWIVFYYTEFKKVDLDFISYNKVSKEEINEQKAKLDQEINDNPSTAEVRSFFQSASRELDTALAFKHDKD